VSRETFRILHVMRSPVGGLFRHVLDLAREQTSRGHAVGIVADSTTGGEPASRALAEIEPKLNLGLSRVPMSRQAGLLDRGALRHVAKRTAATKANVLHGHGAKGGAYVRLTKSTAIRVYTPHGGSLNFSPYSPVGFVYLTIERWLRRRTDLLLFESEFAERKFRSSIGEPPFHRVVHNGIGDADLVPVEPDEDAADFIYIGEMLRRKGVDVAIDALSHLATGGWNGRAILYGSGPDRASFEQRAAGLGLVHQVSFAGTAKAREAFRSGRVLLMPSRTESLPYVVLEAIAAKVPLICTNVGGIPEIYGPDAHALLPPGDVSALAAEMRRMQSNGDPELIDRLRARIAKFFTVDAMTEAILAAYAEALARKVAAST
jgi:glycosyltransferase involved in cell wall biosynthesis